MAITVIDPVSRIEGHLKVQIEVNQGQITDALVSGTLFRGFENILLGRSPDDAPYITQRVCGVCPISHGQAAVLALENTSSWLPSTNGRILRNLVLGANYIQSHLLHFYVLCLVDFVAGPQTSPWASAWDVDMRPGLDGVMDNFTLGIEARRQAHEMGAIFGGKLPHAASYAAGGLTPSITSDKIDRFRNYLTTLSSFINNIYLPDVQAVADVYDDYLTIGAGPENLLAFGVFEQADQSKLFQAGYLEKGAITPSTAFDSNDITENVTSSWYENSPPLSPANGVTTALYPKEDAYSWLKAPRLFNNSCEVGPLARMKISGEYNGTISCMDRHLARAHEAALVAEAMDSWLGELSNGSAFDESYSQSSGFGQGWTEAPRGALGHWLNIDSQGQLDHYQIITPTCWNASPKDGRGQNGPLEQALIGTPIQDENQPIEALRIIHSFDPCLACAVHVLRPSGEELHVLRAG